MIINIPDTCGQCDLSETSSDGSLWCKHKVQMLLLLAVHQTSLARLTMTIAVLLFALIMNLLPNQGRHKQDKTCSTTFLCSRDIHVLFRNTAHIVYTFLANTSDL